MTFSHSTRTFHLDSKPYKRWRFALATAVALLAAAFGTAVFIDRGDAEARDPRRDASVTRTQPAVLGFIPAPSAPVPPLHVDAVVTTASPATAAEPAASPFAAGWRTVLESGAGLRAFAERARRSPSDGGWFYARMVAHLCMQAAAAPQPADRKDKDGRPAPLDFNNRLMAQAVTGVQQINAECAQFTPDELQALLDVDGSVRPDDPLLSIGEDSAEARVDAAARARFLQRALSTRDPALLNSLGVNLASFTSEAGEMYLHIGGTDYTTEEQAALAYGAIELLPCAFGMPCSSTTQDLMLDCMNGRGCYDSRMSKVREQFAQGDEARLRAILALREQLVVAVRAGNAGIFIPAGQRPGS